MIFLLRLAGATGTRPKVQIGVRHNEPGRPERPPEAEVGD